MEFRVKEEQTPGTFLGSISQKYNDKRDGLRFILARPSHTTTDDLFEVDSVSGNITTTAVIDREVLCQFTPGCVVRLEVAAQTNDNFFDIIDIDIVIEDINDNSPTFSQQSVALSISEAVLTGGSLIIDGARDIDKSELFSLQGYSLEPQISGDALPFSVNFVRSLDGGSKVKIIVNEILDRETRDSYRFFLLAKDGGSPPKQGSMFVTVTSLT
ncbi:hypothetical protein DPMN_103222 [Dreissena polymorpha]|uniref:Cadherin domain-containing protein n=1 Tax=Dreissena polymorpha TaxID=45954 RepID=A0A9D4H7H9_DREPO|nr:hypothetical protein DPMN_103222 [Dreissena polymorpha]